MDKTNFSAIANLINDCWMYFSDVTSFQEGSSEYFLYSLLQLASNICDNECI